MTAALLKSKFYKPPLRPESIPRPHLPYRTPGGRKTPRLRALLFGTACGFFLASIIWSLNPCACSP